jgi:hypothetical protein
VSGDEIKLNLLWNEIALMDRAVAALRKSWLECQGFITEGIFPIEEMDRLELLSSRFSRLTDFMIQRIFRLIDELDLESSGTVRDVINRAAKKGLIADVDAFIEARILRNKIAHEYVEKVMTEIFNEALRLVPTILDAAQRIKNYIKRYSA